ncbi:hypothetical protein LAC03_25570 [Levilactobacillus acidifarinae]|nr:hypothetical protein LAC03_25570 [Levilactobacillus acidifarinae]
MADAGVTEDDFAALGWVVSGVVVDLADESSVVTLAVPDVCVVDVDSVTVADESPLADGVDESVVDDDVVELLVVAT